MSYSQLHHISMFYHVTTEYLLYLLLTVLFVYYTYLLLYYFIIASKYIGNVRIYVWGTCFSFIPHTMLEYISEDFEITLQVYQPHLGNHDSTPGNV